MGTLPQASMREFRRHRAGEQGDEAPPPAPPTLSSVPESHWYNSANKSPHKKENCCCIGSFPLGKKPSPASQFAVPRGLRLAAERCPDSFGLAVRDGRREYSVSGADSKPERLPYPAGAFTKGCVGVQPQGKERLNNLANEDRDNNPISQLLRTRRQPNPWPQEALGSFSARGTHKKTPGPHLTNRALSGTWHPNR
jgi:hypothetical protein